MSAEHPELIFLTGPQAGQRVRLTQPVAILGRGSGSDILLSEDYVSRQQMRYELLRAGPAIENLSPRGTWINGKRYKTGQKVLLATGDVIGVGHETQILFVAAGDDPERALQTWRARSRRGGRDAFGRKIQPAPKATPPPPGPPEPAAEEMEEEPARPERRPKRPSEMTADERAELAKKERRRKLLIGLGAWWGLLLLGMVLGSLYLGTNPEAEPAEQTMLNAAQIERFLKQPVERTPNPLQKERKLRQALKLYRQYGTNPLHLQEMVQAFKEALAYAGRSFFEDPEHDRIFRNCQAELIRIVQERYRHACLLEKNQDWAAAEAEFRSLLAIVRDDKNPIFHNVTAHLARVKYYRKKTEPKRNPLFR